MPEASKTPSTTESPLFPRVPISNTGSTTGTLPSDPDQDEPHTSQGVEQPPDDQPGEDEPK